VTPVHTTLCQGAQIPTQKEGKQWTIWWLKHVTVLIYLPFAIRLKYWLGIRAQWTTETCDWWHVSDEESMSGHKHVGYAFKLAVRFWLELPSKNQRKSHKNDTRVNKAITEVIDVTVDCFQKATFSYRHQNFPVKDCSLAQYRQVSFCVSSFGAISL
jgi:hypothetical protein